MLFVLLLVVVFVSLTSWFIDSLTLRLPDSLNSWMEYYLLWLQYAKSFKLKISSKFLFKTFCFHMLTEESRAENQDSRCSKKGAKFDLLLLFWFSAGIVLLSSFFSLLLLYLIYSNLSFSLQHCLAPFDIQNQFIFFFVLLFFFTSKLSEWKLQYITVLFNPVMTHACKILNMYFCFLSKSIYIWHENCRSLLIKWVKRQCKQIK